MRPRSAFSRPDGDFASILASLDASANNDFVRPVAGVERLWSAAPHARQLPPEAIETFYAEHLPEPGAPTGPELPDFEHIAGLISAARSANELHRLRRALALAAHPDRVSAESRAGAERLMAKINAAIDRALCVAG
jgi:hypothetical protein